MVWRRRSRDADNAADAGVPAIEGYRDLRIIGSGGFSKVYTAFQEEFSRTVAVKVITVALDADARRRFARERAITGQLDGHPHIVRVYDSGETATGAPFLAMEHHEHGSLADRVRRHGPLSPAEVLDIGVCLGDALDFAHRRGVVHRDVKPQNVLSSTFVGPVLADFGIAVVDDLRLTTVAHEAFSVTHAAPEVLAGEPATPLADLYSLASTLYELLAARAPFADDRNPRVLALLHRVQHDPVPPIGRGDVPELVERELLALLARDPAGRPPTGSAFADRLRAVQTRLGLTVTTGGPVPFTPTSVSGGSDDWSRWAPPSPGPTMPPIPHTPVAPVSPLTETPGDGVAARHPSTSDTAAGSGSVPAETIHLPNRPTPDVPPGPRPSSRSEPSRADAASGSWGSGGTPRTPPAEPGSSGGERPSAAVRPIGAATVALERRHRPTAPPPALPPPSGRRHPALVTAAVAAGAASVAGASVIGLRLSSHEADTAASTAVAPIPATTVGGAVASGRDPLPCPSRQPGDLGNRPLRKGAPPTDVAVRGAGDGRSATVRWADPTNGLSAFVVFARCTTVEGPPVLAVQLVPPGSPASITVNGLRPDANYCFSVGVVEPSGGTTLFTDPADRSQFRCLDGSHR